jgi:hypothetical protein
MLSLWLPSFLFPSYKQITTPPMTIYVHSKKGFVETINYHNKRNEEKKPIRNTSTGGMRPHELQFPKKNPYLNIANPSPSLTQKSSPNTNDERA